MTRFKTTAVAVVCGLAILAPTASADSTQGDVSTPYAATRATDRPVLITIHGGGWAGNTSEATRPLAERLHRMGYPVINAAYRVSCYGYTPGCARVDKLVLDVARQVRWARQHHAELGTTSRQVVLIGLSAGGQIATLLTARGVADAAIGFSAPTVLPGVVAYLEQNVTGLMGCRVEDCPQAWWRASAAHYKTTRPMWLAYGQHEVMVPALQQGDPMHDADPNALIVRLPGTPHCCTGDWEYPVLPRALAYINQHLKEAS